MTMPSIPSGDGGSNNSFWLFLKLIAITIITGMCWYCGLGIEWMMNTPNSWIVLLGVVLLMTMVAIWVTAFKWLFKDFLIWCEIKLKDR